MGHPVLSTQIAKYQSIKSTVPLLSERKIPCARLHGQTFQPSNGLHSQLGCHLVLYTRHSVHEHAQINLGPLLFSLTE